MAQLHPLLLWLWANRKHESWVLPYSFWQQTVLLFPTSLSLHTFASAVCLPMTLCSLTPFLYRPYGFRVKFQFLEVPPFLPKSTRP